MNDKPTRIIRADHDADFFISTRIAPQDKTLSWEARGMLWYLLSKPDDWEIQPKDLEQNCGHSRVYKLLKELRDHRYVKLITLRDDKNRIIGYVYEVYETPYPEEQPQAKTEPVAKKQQAEIQQAEKLQAEIQQLTDIENIQNRDKEIPASKNTAKQISPPKPIPPPKTDSDDPATYEEWIEYLRKEFHVGMNSSRARNLYNMLKGRSQTGEWKANNILPGATLDQLRRWVAFEKNESLVHRGKAEFLYGKAESINARFLYWRERWLAQQQAQAS